MSFGFGHCFRFLAKEKLVCSERVLIKSGTFFCFCRFVIFEPFLLRYLCLDFFLDTHIYLTFPGLFACLFFIGGFYFGRRRKESSCFRFSFCGDSEVARYEIN